MKVVVTGGFGFLGWHIACRLRAKHPGIHLVRLGRNSLGHLEPELVDADVVLHLAGVSRAASDELVYVGNVGVAEELSRALLNTARPLRVVNANSVQSRLENAYGRSKSAAAAVLSSATERVGGSFVDVVLPNLFGEHGRPNYNSFVATFVHELAEGRTPVVTQDRAVPLLHVQEAADALISAALGRESGEVVLDVEERRVGAVLTTLECFRRQYSNGEIPDLTSTFARDLFNTYRAAVFPRSFPVHPSVHSDPRGMLFETSRSHGGSSQTFVSTTLPGRTRGDHYHLHKVERFVVLRGEAEIALRRLLTDEIVRFRISEDRPGFVDMPTLWVHNLRNVGSTELVTMFWSDQLLEADNVDQFPEAVEVPA